MRVISGTAKGHKLFSLEGNLTRPTTDRVKESMFSIIQFYINESRVLDLFSGSGALGIEALSRGACFCDFVEQNPSACEVIRKNLEKTKLCEFSKLHKTSAFDFLQSVNEKYDIILLDPPYNKKLCDNAMSIIAQNKLLNTEGIIVTETSSDEEIVSDYTIKRQSVYGNTKLTIWVI